MKQPSAPTAQAPAKKTGREVTLHDVARAVQMSVGTVSMALNDKECVSARTRDRVQQVARELGFRPNSAAQLLVAGRQDKTIARHYS